MGESKGIGATGIFLIIITAAFFFTMFYIVLDGMMGSILPQLTDNSDTLTYFNTYLLPIWDFMPWLFLLSVVLYGVIQIQNPFSVGAFAGVWVTVTFSYFVMCMMFVVLDPWVYTDLPVILPMATEYSDYYANGLIPLWRTAPIALSVVIFLFGLWFATTYFEQGGRVYQGGGSRW